MSPGDWVVLAVAIFVFLLFIAITWPGERDKEDDRHSW